MKLRPGLLWMVSGFVVIAVVVFSVRRDEKKSPRGEPVKTALANGPDVSAKTDSKAEKNSASYAGPSKTVSNTAGSAQLRYFGQAGLVTISDVPAGRFKDRLAKLTPAARLRALKKLEVLRVPLNDVGSLDVDDDGALFYHCEVPLQAESTSFDEEAIPEGPLAASVPISAVPVKHSRPGATKIIYLDFNGHTITGTSWNNSKGSPGDAGYRPAVASYVARPFDSDGAAETFSDSEQAFINEVWERVAEDFKGFDVDVTTEEPTVFTATTGRVLITTHVDASGVSMPSPTAGGVALLDVFGNANYATYASPALVYFDNLSSNSTYIAEAASHEIGHNLSLSHDGTTTQEYYSGHGSGSISWGPIMGSSYNRSVTQWSKGEYYGANNFQDDLAILAGHLGYVADDYGDTNVGAAAANPGTGSFQGSGVIGSTSDADRFAFTVAASTALQIYAYPFRGTSSGGGGNLDLRLQVYDASGGLVASDINGESRPWAELDLGLTAGTYYLRISGTGTAAPAANPPSGYTNYGSIGQYTFVAFESVATPPGFSSQPASATVQAGQSAGFSVYATGNPAPSYQWQRLPAGGAEWLNLTDASAYSGTTTSYLQVSSTLAMSGDQFRCRIANIAGAGTSNIVSLTVNPAIAPQVYNMPAFVPVSYGGTLNISPTTSGTWPMTYVWRKDGVVISGATNSSYSKSAVTTADNGIYTVTATNLAGSATSSGATASVNAPLPPAVYNMPSAAVVPYGNSVSFYPTVSGTSPITYQWKRNGVAIAGATNLSFSRGELTPADSGNYTVTATNAFGSFTSSAVSITVTPAVAPQVFLNANDASVAYGESVNFYASVSGTGPLAYQWKKDGVTLAGAISSSFYKSNVTSADSGAYTLTVTNSVGTAVSSPVTITVRAAFAPIITGLQSSLSVKTGDTLYFYPSVSGTNPIAYQWKKNGAVIPNATSQYLSKGSLTVDDAGTYILVASNSVGTVESNPVVVSVAAAVAPSIHGLPAKLFVAHGETIALSPTVRGTSPMTFRWRKDGAVLIDGASQYYSKQLAGTADTGNYTLTATNSVGSVTSTPVAVEVASAIAPTIFDLPASVSVESGGSFDFRASVYGSRPFAFVWLKDGVEINSDITTNSSISFYKSSATTADSGDYALKVTNDAGTVTSAPVVVRVSPAVAPQITNMPATVVVNFGNALQISPTVSGTGPLVYVWRKNGVIVSGQTDRYFYRSGFTSVDAGNYTVTATNPVGTATSSVTVVSAATVVAPVIYGMPQAVVVEYGQSLSISASVSGSSTMSYVWRKDGVVLSGATSDYFYKSSVTTADAGSYTLTAANSAGSVTSSAVPVIVNAARAPQIFGLPQTVAVSYGNSVNLYPNVSGTSPMTYQWKKDGVDIPGANSSSFNRSLMLPADAGQYVLTATNFVGSATSDAVTVVVSAGEPPGIYNLPQAFTVDYGNSLSFSATISGTSPRTIQWNFNGEPIPGYTGSSFYKSYATLADSGNYSLTVTNEFGTVTSAVFPVTVRNANPPVIVRQPTALTVALGLTATFYINATGTSPLSYQWYFNGAAIAGATSYGLTLTNVQAAKAGSYHAVATTPAGSVASQAATLTIDTGLPVAGISAGAAHSLFVRADGTAWAAGITQYVDGINLTSQNPKRVATEVAKVSAGREWTFILKLDGTLWAAGNNASGVLGVHQVTNVPSPVQIADQVVAVSTGGNHTCFIKSDGTLWAMGDNSDGQLGDGTLINRGTAVQIETGVASVSAGAGHTLFVKTDGTLWAMGRNFSGALGDGTTTQRRTPVQIASGVAHASAGDVHSLFVKMDGTLWAIGENGSGQLGDTTTTDRLNPVQVASAVKMASASTSYSLFVTTSGKLFGMGYASSGQMASNSYNSVVEPYEIVSGVAEVSTNGGHTLYVSTDGSLWSMGSNYNGQLGDGTTSTRYAPIQVIKAVPSLPLITTQPVSQALIQGNRAVFTVGVLGYGEVSYQWYKDGILIAGAAGASLVIPDFQASDAGLYTVTVTNGVGTVTSAGSSLAVAQAPVIASQPSSRAVGVGSSTTFAVTVTSNAPVTYQWIKDGTPIGGAKQASLVLSNVQSTDAGVYTVMVSNVVGSLVSQSATLTVQAAPVFVLQPSDKIALAAVPVSFAVGVEGTDSFTLQWERKASGAAQWLALAPGADYSGTASNTLTVLSPVTANSGDQFRCIATSAFASATSAVATLTVSAPGVVKISAGRYHSARLDSAGQLYTAGMNADGQLGTGTTANASTAQLVSIAGKTIADVAAGGQHLLLLTVTKELYASGSNATGQLGDGTFVSRATPVQVATDVVKAAAGVFHSAYLKSDGTLWTVGGNDAGQLGDGTTVNRSTAVQIATGVIDVAAGIRQTLFLKSDGSLWASGNLDGSATYVSTPVRIANEVTAMAAGGYHSLFIKTDGTLWGVGYNAYGQLGDGTTTTRSAPVQIDSDVKAATAGFFHSLFIKTDNTLWAMGYNNSSQLGDGTVTSRTTPFQMSTQVVAVSATESYTLFTKQGGSLWGTGGNANGQFGNGNTASVATPVQITTGALTVPAVPLGLTASPLAEPNSLRLTWQPAADAATYDVWIYSENTPHLAIPIGRNLRAPIFEISHGPGYFYYYWVTAVNSAGNSGFSAMVNGSFNPLIAPQIFTQPTGATVESGNNFVFSVDAGGALPLHYQWFRDGVLVEGATHRDYAIYNVTPSQAGIYSVIVANSGGSVTSSSARLSLVGQPFIVSHPVDRIATPGSDATFSVVAGGTGPFTYQWRNNGLNLTAGGNVSGTTSATLLISSALLENIGSYDVVVRNAVGEITSGPAALVVAENFASWKGSRFTSLELGDINLSGPNADPDGDGLPNLLEYALGLEPKTAETVGVLEVAATATDWTYTYKRPTERVDINYMVELSTGLSTWTTNGVTHELVSAAGGVETWRATVPLTAGANVFFRLKVSVP